MNRFRRIFNRTVNMSRESSFPDPRIPQAGPTHPSSSPAESWTTHNSNLALLECLSIATPTRPALPAELIFQLLNHPTRWVYLHSNIYPSSVEPDKPIALVRNRPTGIPVLYTRPFTAQEVGRLRKVVFTFRSRDQGYCSRPDQGCWSWFEASLAHLPSTDEDGQDQENDAAERTGSLGWSEEWMERYEKSLENQPRYRIQENRLASIETEQYTIELTAEHELVQRAGEGDRVVLWACACFPGWENRVYEAKISAHGIDDLTMD